MVSKEKFEGDLEELALQARRAIFGSLDDFLAGITALAQQLIEATEAERAASSGAVGGGHVDDLAESVEYLATAHDQNAAAKQLLNAGYHVAQRAVLFAIRSDRAFGWQAIGVGGSEEIASLKHVTLDLDDSFVGQAIRSGVGLQGKLPRMKVHAAFVEQLGGAWPKKYFAKAIFFQGKPVLVFYADDGGESDGRFGLAPLRILATVAELAMENNGLRRNLERQVEEGHRPKSGTTGKMKTERGTGKVRTKGSTGKMRTRGTTGKAPLAAGGRQGTDRRTTGRQRAVRPSTRPSVDLDGLDKDTRRRHEKARRKARVIVQDIVAYNKDKIDRGRRMGNLAEVLADDIRRGRQLYASQIDPDIDASTDYFSEVLVEMVAGGDASALGL